MSWLTARWVRGHLQLRLLSGKVRIVLLVGCAQGTGGLAHEKRGRLHVEVANEVRRLVSRLERLPKCSLVQLHRLVGMLALEGLRVGGVVEAVDIRWEGHERLVRMLG